MTTVVSVHSFRGGTGKSNTTANVAANLTAAGARVAIIDTDVQSPGIHTLFGFDQTVEQTLDDYLWGRIDITGAVHDVTDRVGATDGGQLFLVPASMRASDIARILRDGYDVIKLNEGFRDLSEGLDLDYLFIDTHPGLNEETMLSITVSDVLLLLLRPDKQDFQGTAVTVDIARRLSVPNLLLVLNKVPEPVDMDDLRAQMDQAYGAPTAAILPLSTQMVINASAGLFSMTHPDHPWSEGIRMIAGHLREGAGGQSSG
ncbi:MAG: MinD/ParA family protein [Micrococcales bacterium]|nr:MinD/ParA family protein [Micrococcales bacterium]